MTDFRSETTIGARIRAARRQRGFATTRELAASIRGAKVSEATLENIESGRKADIGVSQLLNIARALDVPPSLLLAPLGRPDDPIDLPNLSEDFEGMTAAEFDCWLSATAASSYTPRHAAERVDIGVLESVRQLGTLRRELDRLKIVLGVQASSGDSDLDSATSDVQERIDRISGEATRVAELLASAGISGLGEVATPKAEKREGHA